MEIMAISSKGSPGWDNYGLSQDVRLTTQWQPLTLTFEAKRTVHDARIQFLCGGEAGTFWIDDVSLKEHGEEVFRRDFENGVVLLNGTRRRQTVDVGPGLARLSGSQAPRFQYILDDGGNSGFKTTGAWREIPLGTKEWHAIPPYYHAWNNRCRTLLRRDRRGDLGSRSARSRHLHHPGLVGRCARARRTGPARPCTRSWPVVRSWPSRTLDQTRAGDEWHTLCRGAEARARPATCCAPPECGSWYSRCRCPPRILGRALQRRQRDRAGHARTDGRDRAAKGHEGTALTNCGKRKDSSMPLRRLTTAAAGLRGRLPGLELRLRKDRRRSSARSGARPPRCPP